MRTFDHQQLCALAVRWLKRPAGRSGPGCQIAFSESRADNRGEVPDAIGFRAGIYQEASVIVECKVTRSDFLSDRKKPHRLQSATGMGLYRYFMAPQGLILAEELPEGWGLLEVNSRGVITCVAGHVRLGRGEEDVFKNYRAISREWTLLAKMLSRVSDPEAVQKEVRAARNEHAKLAQRCIELEQTVRKLQLDLFLARSPAGSTSAASVAVPRARQKTAPAPAARA